MYLIESESHKGTFWKIRATTKGYRCSCPRFIFKDREPCKHIIKLLNTKKTEYKEKGIIETEDHGNR